MIFYWNFCKYNTRCKCLILNYWVRGFLFTITSNVLLIYYFTMYYLYGAISVLLSIIYTSEFTNVISSVFRLLLTQFVRWILLIVVFHCLIWVSYIFPLLSILSSGSVVRYLVPPVSLTSFVVWHSRSSSPWYRKHSVT